MQEEQKNIEALKISKKKQNESIMAEYFEQSWDLMKSKKRGSNLKLKTSSSNVLKNDYSLTALKKQATGSKKIIKTEESDNEEFDRAKIKEALESLKFENFTSILTTSSPLASLQPLSLIKHSSTSSKFSSNSNSAGLRMKLPSIN